MAEVLKEEGNKFYADGLYTEAIEKFTAALELSPENEVLYLNRSMSHAALKNWKASVTDARKAILIKSSYHKAHYRVVKGLIELACLKEARLCLLTAISACGDKKEFKQLEADILSLVAHPLRPRPHEFEILEELGTGNFTTIYKAKYRATNAIYAIKVRQ